jgi:hypothetical protein
LSSIYSFNGAQALTNREVIIVATVIPYCTMEAFDVIGGETSGDNELKSSIQEVLNTVSCRTGSKNNGFKRFFSKAFQCTFLVFIQIL